MYRAVFSRRAHKAFLDLTKDQAERVRDAIVQLMIEPHGRGTIKLEHAPVAQYRRRVGDWRILLDIDEKNKVVEVLDIRKRDERTYK